MTSAAGAVAGAGLSARLRVDRGRFRLAADLEAANGEIVALLGPNGAGKTTALQVLAGLVPLSAGRVVVGGEVYDDPDAARWVPAQRRSVGVVPQDHLLFPHLSAQDNVAFGLRARGATRRAARNEAHRWLDRLGVADLAGERPARLSGGQAQRVALARALAVEPALLLLDEPLAALDARTRLEVRAELRGHLAGFAGVALLVTHEPLDAMVLADRLVVLEDGAVVQQGPPAHVARHPRTDYVARLAGLNLLAGRATGRHTDVATEAGVDADTGAPTDALAQRVVQLPAGGRVVVPSPATGDVLVAFAPAAVSLHLSRPSGSARNAWPGRVIGLVPHGDLVRVEVDGQVPLLADVTPAAVAELALGPGVGVWAAVKASEVTCYPV